MIVSAVAEMVSAAFRSLDLRVRRLWRRVVSGVWSGVVSNGSEGAGKREAVSCDIG